MTLLVILRDTENKIKSLKSKGVKDFFYGFHFLQNNNNVKILYLIRSKPNTIVKYLCFPFEKLFSKFTTLGFHLDILIENFKIIKNSKKIFTPTDGLSFAILLGKIFKFHNANCYTLFQSLSERKKKFQNNYILTFFIILLLKKSKLIIVLSEISRLKLIQQFKLDNSKVAVFRFGVDMKYWSTNKFKNIKYSLPKRYILSVGNDMNRDFQILNKIQNDIPIVLVSQKKMKNLKNVIFLHNITNDELKYLYHNCYFVIIPIKKIESESAGLSTIMQSMSSSKLTLIPNNKPLLEYFENKYDVLFYDAENVNSLQNAIKFIKNNSNIVNKIEVNALNTIKKKYNIEKMEEQHLNNIKI
tara:strand:+ start:509 stop:1579 length:1071 start_codon:yes stop_codon:yes gene_type:complete